MASQKCVCGDTGMRHFLKLLSIPTCMNQMLMNSVETIKWQLVFFTSKRLKITESNLIDSETNAEHILRKFAVPLLG